MDGPLREGRGFLKLIPLMWGGHPVHGPIEVTCLVLGGASIMAARFPTLLRTPQGSYSPTRVEEGVLYALRGSLTEALLSFNGG